MNGKEDCLFLINLLDLDEEVIDIRLKSIMVRDTFTSKHLKSAILMLLYKQMINTQEGTECENNEEFDFVVKLIRNVDKENIVDVCKITNIVLSLNTTALVSKSEHLLQQILSNIELPSEHRIDEAASNVLYFRICDSILDAVIHNGEKISLIFLETPIENVLFCNSELKVNFLNSTVPRLFKCVIGYNILDKIWSLLTQNSRDIQPLQVLSCLSDFYLPVDTKIVSDMVLKSEFWNIVLNGLNSEDFSQRKLAVYLAKRALDNVENLNINVYVEHGNDMLLSWDHKSEIQMRSDWDNFFILIDSLEEKQSNIVLPSLQLFNSIQRIGSCWIDCAFNLGLKHDNVQVRIKCIEKRLKIKLKNKSQADLLLEALNDIYLYDTPSLFENVKEDLIKTLQDNCVLEYVLECIPLVKWSPVPLFYISKTLTNLDTGILKHMTKARFVETIIDTLKLPCNDVVLRKAIHTNILHFIKCFNKILDWRDYAKMYTFFKVDPKILQIHFKKIIPTFKNNEDRNEFISFISSSYAYIDFGLLNLYTDDNKQIWADIITEKVHKIVDVTNRQYSNKAECLNDFIFLINVYVKAVTSSNTSEVILSSMITGSYKLIIRYVFELLTTDVQTTIDENNLIFKGFKIMCENLNGKEEIHELLNLYKSAIIVLDKDLNISKKALSVFIINSLHSNYELNKSYKHEMLDLQTLLKFINVDMKKSDNSNTGRFTNVLYEKSCELTYKLLKESDKNNTNLIDYIEKVTDCGGYGCLKWILKIMNIILPKFLKDDNKKQNIVQFINRMWKEIEELKSNSQYNICMEEFIKLITQDAILNDSAYNNLVLSYCNKIIEYGPVKNTPLMYLVKELHEKVLNLDNGHVIYIITEILLFSPVTRKDQRILENTAVKILSNPKYAIDQQSLTINFNYQIQFMAISILSKIKHNEILSTITSILSQRLNEILQNKQRYHGNSQLHKNMLIAIQHLLFILLLRQVSEDEMINWSLKLLGRLPHQPSVRICLEWYIALALYFKREEINAKTLDKLKSYNLPITSQFIIIYWILLRKITANSYDIKEYEFVMDTLLTNTMGQMFNIRLLAQYLATKLYKIGNKQEKYAFIIDIIEINFQESCKDKNFKKLQEDYFVNNFDIERNLSPCFIYYFLPMYFELCDANIDIKYLRQILNNIESNFDFNNTVSEDIFEYNFGKTNETNRAIEHEEAVGNIQKKYIPWKSMNDVDVYAIERKRESTSELILVASLVDKLPNLGGMARTSEVFGVKTYVVDSLRHLQDKQFQSLSVSAERWVNIEEVRPGHPLKEYLMRKKTEGYTILAAEQTSNSVKLQSFKFPRKSLLLLGHEKEGIPCDLLPLMDQCVEIPQQGFVRSLNVHVTAAIFVWEYSRQNLF